MISEEKVLHIADLAKINIDKEEIKKYQEQLTDILTEIDKIQEVSVDGDIMISPITTKNNYTDDVIENHISREDAFKNAKRVSEDYIIVPKVIE